MKKYQLGALTVSDKGLQDTKEEIVIELIDRMQMKYKVCDHCGAHLDNGETCDCRNTNNDGGEPKDKQKERKNDNDGN